MRTPTLLLALLLTSVAFAGCADDAADDPTPGTSTPTGATPTTSTPTGGTPTTNGTNAPSEAVFTAKQSAPPAPNATITYGFDGPDVVRDGWVTITVRNVGMELHQVTLLNLGNLSYDAFVAGLAAPANGTNGTGAPAAAPLRAGGVGAVGPGANATAIVHLAPGTYAAVCFIPGPDGTPHAMHGMVRKLTVVKGQGAGAPEPVADATLTLRDYKFNLSQNLTAGRHVIKVVNEGPHHHEAPLVFLAPNATAKDFLDYFAPGATPQGPPPVRGASGASPIEHGKVEYIVVDLAAGHYAFICFEQDTPQSPPHFALGMVHEFDVA